MMAPGYSATEYGVSAGATAALFVLSHVGHEFTHAMVARRLGLRALPRTLPVRDIMQPADRNRHPVDPAIVYVYHRVGREGTHDAQGG